MGVHDRTTVCPAEATNPRVKLAELKAENLRPLVELLITSKKASKPGSAAEDPFSVRLFPVIDVSTGASKPQKSCAPLQLNLPETELLECWSEV
jgi:hypothetical protein